MKIKLLQNRVRVQVGNQEGYLIEAFMDQHAVIGVLSDAGVFRPITEPKRCTGLEWSRDFLSVLPQYLEFAAELCARQILARGNDNAASRRTESRQKRESTF